MPQRATKIVATLGPASSDPALLEAMIRAGVNVVRLNFSHGKAQDHIDRAALVREAALRAGREVGIMADLQGPKIRVGKFAEGKVMLEPGQPFVLDAARTEPGDIGGVGLDYKELPRDVKAGDTLLLNDGLIVLTVDRVAGEAVYTTVKLGGELSNNKGINKQGGVARRGAEGGNDLGGALGHVKGLRQGMDDRFCNLVSHYVGNLLPQGYGSTPPGPTGFDERDTMSALNSLSPPCHT